MRKERTKKKRKTLQQSGSRPAVEGTGARCVLVLVTCKPRTQVLCVCLSLSLYVCVCAKTLVRYIASAYHSCNARTNLGRVRRDRTNKTRAGSPRTRRCKAATPRLPASQLPNAVVK